MPLECALYYSNGIKGSNTRKGRADSSVVIEFNHEIYSPVDTQRGIVTGARVHRPIIVKKEIDKATPRLYKAATTGEMLVELRVDWDTVTPVGQLEVYFKTTFRRVKVASVENIFPNTKDPTLEEQTHLEVVQFLYEEIEWEWMGKDGSIIHMDSWAQAT